MHLAGRDLSAAKVSVIIGLMFGAALVAAIVPTVIAAVNPSSARPAPETAPEVSDDEGQIVALADGVISRDEYDAAVDRTLDCVREAGGEIVDLRYEDWRDRPVWNFAIRWSGSFCRRQCFSLRRVLGSVLP